MAKTKTQPKLTLTTWEAVCEFKKMDPAVLPIVDQLPVRHQKFITGSYQLAIVMEALNEQYHGRPWKPDYNDQETYKYEPWFGIEASKEQPSGFGFSYSYCDLWLTFSGCGSRLAGISSDVIGFAQEHFKQLFMDVWIIPAD
jgi:hypothetical protein